MGSRLSEAVRSDREKIKRAKDAEAARRRAHRGNIAQMMRDLPSIPYVSHPSEARIAWKRACIEAGYPRCEECTMPISRSHWYISITQCHTCLLRDLGLLKW